MNTTQSLKKPLVLWGLASLFFGFQFILRLVIGILREEIIQKFVIDTVEFGSLAGYYYLGYAGMQIPVGIMLDKFNLRVVMFISILVTSIGTIVFVASDNFYYLLIARFITGAGSAVGFLSIAKIITLYFPAKYHSLMLGFSFTFGLIGAVFGVTPMKILFECWGYYYTFYVLALIGFIIGLIILLINNNYNYNNNHRDYNKLQIFKLLFNPTILLIGISGGLMVGTLEGFADVWAMPFFQQLYNMSVIDSSIVTSFVYIGMCFGGPILALTANLFKSSNFVIIMTGIFTIIVFVVLLYYPSLDFFKSSFLMFLLGIFCCYQVLIFTIVSNIVEKESAGLAVSIINCINMSFGYFFHKLITILISYNWDGLNEANMPIYSRNDFITAISVVPTCCFIGILGFIFLSIKLQVQDTAKFTKLQTR